MPTYTYQCDDCGHSFDVFQKFSEDTLTVCPTCEGFIRRVIQPTPIVFKGSGWYINDSKGKNATMSNSAPAKDGETKSDAAPEVKTESKTESKAAEPAATAAAPSASS
ncbi:MAG: FmdB family zinc ribbon protein [Thermomicrobiales bacterium]